MGGLDLFLAAVLGLGVWRGIRTGALLQLVGTVGWVFAFVAGTALMEPVGELVARSMGVSPRTAPVLGFIVTFGGIVAALTAVAHVARTTLQAIKLGGADALAGAAVGGVRAAFGLSVFLVATGFAPGRGGDPLLLSRETREGSVLYEPVRAVAPEVWGVVRTITPGLQAALVDKFNTWQAGDPPSETGEAPLE